MTERRSRPPGRMLGAATVRGSSGTQVGSASMWARVPALLLRPTAPPVALGLLVAALLIAVESALVYLLKRVAPGNIFGVVFLLGVLVVATVWGFRLGVMM